MTKTCALPSCGAEFEPIPKQPGQKYCCQQCGYDAKKLQTAKRDGKAKVVKSTYSARGVPSDNVHPNERVLHSGKFRIDGGKVVPIKVEL